MTESVSLTKAAEVQVASLMADDEMPKNSYLRISVKGGGCSGFQYVFDLIDSTNNDYVFDKLDDGNESSVLIAVDHISYMYLSGAVIDFKSDAMGQRFIVNNPNASTTCSCGDSFSHGG